MNSVYIMTKLSVLIILISAFTHAVLLQIIFLIMGVPITPIQTFIGISVAQGLLAGVSYLMLPKMTIKKDE